MKDSEDPRHQDTTDWLKEENLQLPPDLNNQSVANHLKMISRANPQQLPATVQAIREKWAYMVGGWAERGRLEYVNTVLLQLKISDEILTTCLGMDDKWQTHQQKNASRRSERAVGIPDLEAEAKAEELKARIAKARADGAEADKKRTDFEKPAVPKRDVNQEARRKHNFNKADREVERLITRRDEVLSEYLKKGRFEDLSPRVQEEYIADENRYNQRIREAKERRMQFE